MGILNKIFSSMFEDKDEKQTEEPDLSQVKFIEEDDDGVIQKTMHIDVETPDQQYIVKMDGQYYVYDNKEDMPPELLEQVSQVEHADKTTKSYTVIVDGEQKHFDSVDEMPEDVREAIKNSSDTQ